MGFVKIVAVSFCVLVAALIVYRQLPETQQPEIPEWKNFGRLPDEKALEAEKLAPTTFEVEITDEEIEDYKRRLREARLPPILSDEVNMTFGYPSYALPELRDRMLKCDLKAWAQKLNKYEHFKVTVFGLQIHYLKVSGSNDLKKVPLLLMHGWPGSVYEFYQAIPLLQKKAEKHGFTYDIVVPSLPGYGFSESPYKPGCNARHTAVMFNEVMTRLGYDKYMVQGGDWGAFIAEWIVGLFPDRVIGFHLNMFNPPSFTDDLRVLPYTIAGAICPHCFMATDEAALAAFKSPLDGFKWLLFEGGYFHIQSTKPDSIGASLSDSPLGLAAYILEKFYTWTNANTENKPVREATADLAFSVEEALCDVLIYWHTNTIQSSVRYYRETIMDFEFVTFKRTSVPGALLMTRHEITFSSRAVAELKIHDLRQYTALMKGGHFAAFEIPEEYSDDVVSFTRMLL